MWSLHNVVCVFAHALMWYADGRDLEESLMLLHSYLLVELLGKQGDHDTGAHSHPTPRSFLCIPPRSPLYRLVREQGRRRSQRPTGAKSCGHACRARAWRTTALGGRKRVNGSKDYGETRHACAHVPQHLARQTPAAET